MSESAGADTFISSEGKPRSVGECIEPWGRTLDSAKLVIKAQRAQTAELLSAGSPSRGMVDGSFGMLPNGAINKTLWADFASRGIHEMALKAKALAKAYFARQVSYSYWDGCSTGGRQGLMEAEFHPEDFNGILVGGPAINWTRFITGELYPQVVTQRDLHGVPLTHSQLSVVTAAAVKACDTSLTGEHLGYIADPGMCRYDPSKDRRVLCKSSGGDDAAESCLTRSEAEAVNKIWYGQTPGGTAPDPAVDNGYHAHLATNQLWFGLPRGSDMDIPAVPTAPDIALVGSKGGVPTPFPIASSQVALELQDPSLATPAFHNAKSNGTNGWKALSYAELAHAQAEGLRLQSEFGYINADNPNLAAFRTHGGKLIIYHGMADQLIPVEGTTNFYENVAARMSGMRAIQSFSRYFPIAGMGHCGPPLTDNSGPKPPLPAAGELYGALVSWVERGRPPNHLVVQTTDGSVTQPLCPYPRKLIFTGSNGKPAVRYLCK